MQIHSLSHCSPRRLLYPGNQGISIACSPPGAAKRILAFQEQIRVRGRFCITVKGAIQSEQICTVVRPPSRLVPICSVYIRLAFRPRRMITLTSLLGTLKLPPNCMSSIQTCPSCPHH